MPFTDYWYIVAESHELTPRVALARTVLDERLVCFRGGAGEAVVLRDRCLHRNAPLSAGTVEHGHLRCPYHGWTYDAGGRVTSMPSMGATPLPGQCSPPYPTREQEGYIYVRLNREPGTLEPFAMPQFGSRGWLNLRLQNRFRNTVSNCVENFIDIPHTAFVHRRIFRTSSGERIAALIERRDGTVQVTYRNERANLGSFRWFLNPRGREVRHTDSFHAPNVTSVRYEIGSKVFIITSQSIPVGERETLVYTDLTYTFGVFTRLAAPFVRRHGQRIIDQDLVILELQMENIARYGAEFRHTPADHIHVLVDSIRDAIARGEDPRALPPVTREIEFHV